jgi:segregation and condensation protein A
LIEYRKFKEAARWLRDLDDQGLRSYIRLAGTPPLEPTVDLGDATLDDLLATVREILAIKPPAPSVNNSVPPVIVTIANQMDLIENATASKRTVSFRRILEQAATRLEIIVTLLALLEMVKQLRVTMQQDLTFGDILIVRLEQPPSTANARSSSTATLNGAL